MKNFRKAQYIYFYHTTIYSFTTEVNSSRLVLLQPAETR